MTAIDWSTATRIPRRASPVARATLAGDPSPRADGQGPKLLVTPAQAAESLSLSERTLRRLSVSGELRPVRIGRAVRYSVADLEQWIARNMIRQENPRAAYQPDQ